jgi:glycosyltransferase involved in cell wall biosynthesis
MVADGETGVLVPPADETALAAALSELLGNPERARVMGLAGYQRACDLFTWDAVGERLHAQISAYSS